MSKFRRVTNYILLRQLYIAYRLYCVCCIAYVVLRMLSVNYTETSRTNVLNSFFELQISYFVKAVEGKQKTIIQALLLVFQNVQN